MAWRGARIAFAQARPAGLLLIVCLALACEGAAAAELARGGPFGETFEPIGFDGPDVIVRQGDRVLAFGPAGRRVVAGEKGLEEAVAGSATLALVRRRSDRDELLAGPTGGPRPVVLSCPAGPRRPPPVLAGAVVLWPRCDGLGLIAFTAAGQVVYDAGGRVMALAADGDRVAWAAEGADGRLRVFARSLTAPVTLAGDLGDGAEEAQVSVAVAQDGRVRAWRQDPDDTLTCTTLGDGAAAQPRKRDGACPRRVTFTPEGSVESTIGNGVRTPGAIVRRSRSGTVISTIAAYANRSLARPFVTDGIRIATSLLLCRGSRLVSGELATARFAKASCPIRPTAPAVTATRSGLVRIRVRCARGCLGVGGGMDMRLGSLGMVYTGETLLDLTAGRSGHIAFKLTRGQLRGLRRRGAITARVSIIGYSDRAGFSVRLRAPR